MDLREYITSEKFIWDDLIKRGEFSVTKVRELWKKNGKVPRMLMAWPAVHLDSDDGKIIRDIVSFAIPEDMPTLAAAVELTKRTQAYALLLIEQQPTSLRIVLESHHGSRSWVLPIQRHGDVNVLGKEKASKDTEAIGVLWRPSIATS